MTSDGFFLHIKNPNVVFSRFQRFIELIVSLFLHLYKPTYFIFSINYLIHLVLQHICKTFKNNGGSKTRKLV
jgi:hypothetical protein